jgi:ankyrin repeat protein
MLIKEGVVDLEARDHSGRTPLYWALMGESDENMRTLLSANADAATVDDEGLTLLHHAAKLKSDALMDVLLRHGEAWRVVNFQGNEMREAPLHFAAMFGAGACCDLLLRHKADPGLFTLGGETPVDIARQFRFPDVAERLRELANKSVDAKWSRVDQAASFRLHQKAALLQTESDKEQRDRERKEKEWREADKARRAAEALARQEAAAAVRSGMLLLLL